jgi:hypothetical protein
VAPRVHFCSVSSGHFPIPLLCLNPATQGWPTGGPCLACGDAFVVSLFATLSRVAFIHTERNAADLRWVCGKVGCPWRRAVVRGHSECILLWRQGQAQ